MKILVKYLLVASAIILPAIGYAGSSHSNHESKSDAHEEYQMDEECKKGEDCPMAEKMKNMDDAQSKEHMKEMDSNHTGSTEGHSH